MNSLTYSLGIDIGGTFTDIVLYCNETGYCATYKELTTPQEPYKGAVEGVKHLFSREEVAFSKVTRVIHATTLFTNALIERKGVATGLITTEGFRDTLEIARENKYELYDLHIELPTPLVERRFRLEVPERLTPHGEIEQELDEAALINCASTLQEAGVSSIAIVFLHAYANPVHEIRAKQILAAHFPDISVSISSDVSPQIREYERTVTTVSNAYVKPLAEGYLDKMTEELRGLGISAPLFMMLSNGGLTHVDEAKRVPIQLLESGPAAGALAGAYFGQETGITDILAFDMGGTTAKLAMVRAGKPLVAHRFETGRQKRLTEGSGLPISISTVELIEIGAGGGSLVRLDALGLLKVGPESASSNPGPACYGRGGAQPTVTDANLVLGFLDPANFAGGTMSIDRDLSVKALQPTADAAQISLGKLAWGVHSVVNENMAAAARVHVAERGHNATDFTLLLTGGGGPLHGCEIAHRLGIKKVICPPAAGVASALGLLMAPARIDRMLTVSQRMSRLDWEELEALYAGLEHDANQVIRETLSQGDVCPTIQRAADLRYVGQGFEVITDLPAGPYSAATETAIKQAFEESYIKSFGRLPPVGDVEIVNIRVALTASAGGGALETKSTKISGQHAQVGTRPVWMDADQSYQDIPVYDRDALTTGQLVSGPAVIQEASSTLILPINSQAVVHQTSSLLISLDASRGLQATTELPLSVEQI